LDGSVSSDQISAPATPDVQSLPDNDWDTRQILMQPDSEDEQTADLENPDRSSDIQSIEIAIENSEEDWQQFLGNFPRIPRRARSPPSAREDTPSDSGVFLPEDALATLSHIRLDGTPDPWSETSEGDDEMWQVETPQRPRSADDATPASDLSGYSFSRLSIPSPGGFFASLGPRARHTWSIPKQNNPPTSATAERFYSLPFTRAEGEVVEQIIECPERPENEQLTAVYDPSGPPTAIRIPPEDSLQQLEHVKSPISDDVDAVHEIARAATHNPDEQDDDYESELQKKAMASLDRTSVWLAAQATYLAALCETNPANTPVSEKDNPIETVDGNVAQNAETVAQIARKKSVRFDESVPEAPSSQPSALASKDSIYWRGFQFNRRQSSNMDTFMHRNMRFDAVQSIRLGRTNMHTNCLLGKYELVRPERPPYRGPFSQAPRASVVGSVLEERVQFSMLEKEQLVLAQISEPMWAMDALKYLNGGHLVTSPALKDLRKSNVSPKKLQGSKARRIRVLDLGGHASCEWAWHLAHDYPNVKFYTAFTEHQAVNRGIKGPSNHRQISVQNLWELPFPDNKFDVISARSLPALLKSEHTSAEEQDEYDLCLRECHRCLKPGGYLEFFVMDAEILRAGPHSSATSVEFAFNLKTRGYDPAPTKSFLGRLQKGGFTGTKRVGIFLPMGSEPIMSPVPRETPEPRVKSQISECEAVQGPVGSTADVANITGLLGGWIWEQWLLKLQIEMGRDQGKLLEGIGNVFDEGRKNGAGWTCLSGWSMKPRKKKREMCQKDRRN
jgi:SAM-dependent methyltransferase